MGVLSSLIGVLAAYATLQNIDAIAKFLGISFLGSSIPDTLSPNAVTLVLIVTPLLSLLAGLIPASRACRLKPSEILRAE